MKIMPIVIGLMAATIATAGGYALYRMGVSDGTKMPTAALSPRSSVTNDTSATGSVDSAGRKVLYWHDPMVPGQKFDKPGKSPFMDMPLVPVYADEQGDASGVTIAPRVRQNLGLRTAEVTKGSILTGVEAVGSVAYNERDVALVQARANGFVEKLHVRAPLDPVRKGQALAELYAPDWVAAQEEYLAARRLTTAGLESLTDGARQRMRLAGMSEDQIRSFESSGRVQDRITITAPIAGVITELGAREGMTVMSGAALFRINGLSTVWINAEIPESVAVQVRTGTPAEARVSILPGEVFKGRVSAILPDVNPATRTIKARIELANPKGGLVPGTFATISFRPTSQAESLVIPTEAVIQTGRRSVVIVAQTDDSFAPVDVEIGAESGGQTEIRKGLALGQKVVVSGQFLVDSEASLRSTATRMSDMPQATPKPAEAVHRGEGKVESIGKNEVTLSHGPIPSLQWGAMTMGFKLPADKVPKDVHAGDTVSFEIRQMNDGMFEITKISPIASPQASRTGANSATGSKK
jgi:Cu(I)/Ag(I) efflux system membrane fusion protein